jgi:hypothetical protein
MRVYHIRNLGLGRMIPAMQDKMCSMLRRGFQHFGHTADDYAIWLRNGGSEFSLNSH